MSVSDTAYAVAAYTSPPTRAFTSSVPVVKRRSVNVKRPCPSVFATVSGGSSGFGFRTRSSPLASFPHTPTSGTPTYTGTVAPSGHVGRTTRPVTVPCVGWPGIRLSYVHIR